jgi:predicted transposase YbfD/YdcC
MVTYPLNEVLLVALVGVLCGADDWDMIELLGREYLSWLKQFLVFKHGIPQDQTLRKVFRLLPPNVLEERFAAWVASLREIACEVVAIDGKTLRGSKKSADGKDALHLLSAYACEAGLVIGQRAVDGKSNEITAIPELLDILAIKGAIVSIDAMGTQKAIAARIVEQEADYVLALKGNQSALHDNVKRIFEDAELAKACAVHTTTDTGHGRIEDRTIQATDDIGWLKQLHRKTCAALPPSHPNGSTRNQAGLPRKRAFTSRHCQRPLLSSLPQYARIGGSKTIFIGSWM